MNHSRPALIFLHLPKTGGSTLSKYIHNNMAHPDAYEDEAGFFHSGIYYYPMGFFESPDEKIDEATARILRRDDLVAVVGHLRFGIHEYIPRDSSYITFLREPVSRVISLYDHLRSYRKNDSRIFDAINERGLTPDEVIAEFPRFEFDNDQTRRISGQQPEVGACTQSMLDRAKENLTNHFMMVGTTERYNQSLLLLRRLMEWTGTDTYYPKNESPRRTSGSAVSSKTREIITEYNRLDIELYRFADELLSEAIDAQGDDFRQEVDRFTEYNADLVSQWRKLE